MLCEVVHGEETRAPRPFHGGRKPILIVVRVARQATVLCEPMIALQSAEGGGIHVNLVLSRQVVDVRIVWEGTDGGLVAHPRPVHEGNGLRLTLADELEGFVELSKNGSKLGLLHFFHKRRPPWCA